MADYSYDNMLDYEEMGRFPQIEEDEEPHRCFVQNIRQQILKYKFDEIMLSESN